MTDPFKFAHADQPSGALTRTFTINDAGTSAGDTLVAHFAYNSTTNYPSSVTDSAGNVYTATLTYRTATPCLSTFVADGATGGPGGGSTAALTNGVSTVTPTWNGTSGLGPVVCICLPDVGAIDSISTVAAGSGVTATSGTATPGHDNETILGCFICAQTGASIVANSPLTDLVYYAYTPVCDCGWQALSGGSGVGITRAATLGVSGTWRAGLLTFHPGAAGVTVTGDVTAALSAGVDAGGQLVAGSGSAAAVTAGVTTVGDVPAAGDVAEALTWATAAGGQVLRTVAGYVGTGGSSGSAGSWVNLASAEGSTTGSYAEGVGVP